MILVKTSELSGPRECWSPVPTPQSWSHSQKDGCETTSEILCPVMGQAGFPGGLAPLPAPRLYSALLTLGCFHAESSFLQAGLLQGLVLGQRSRGLGGRLFSQTPRTASKNQHKGCPSPSALSSVPISLMQRLQPPSLSPVSCPCLLSLSFPHSFPFSVPCISLCTLGLFLALPIQSV